MRKIFILIAMFFVVLTTSHSIVSAKDYMRTGKDLSSLTKDAIKKIPTTDLISGIEIPEADRISNATVIEVNDMSAFCKELSISSGDCKKFGMAFTIGQHYPVYLNLDPKMGSEYSTYQNWYDMGSSPQIVYMIAGVLYHESFHARGEKKEAPAYEQELALLNHFKSKGKFDGATWARIIFDNTKKNLDEARKYETADIKIAAK